MRRKRREFSIFTLSFLDIMSCGFGAVVLLFLISKHATVPESVTRELASRASALRSEIAAVDAELDTLAERGRAQDAALAAARQRSDDARAALASAARLPSAQDPTARAIAALRADLIRLEADRKRVLAQPFERAHYVRGFVGPGNREYLTGIQLGGHRILVLLDSSSSMLDASIAQVLRRRSLSPEEQRQAPKWRQAVAVVDWITAHFAAASSFQIYTYDSAARPVLSGTDGQWIDVGDAQRLDAAVDALKQRVPAGGSSLEQALMVVEKMTPAPDNIYLITDSLPTQGLTPPTGTTVNGATRLALFEAAARRVVPSIPINVILLPMEGDPMAPYAYWQLAVATQGAFLSPPADWP